MRHISKNFCGFLFSTGFTSFSVFISSIDHLFGLYAVFDAISSNIDEVLSIDPSANIFVFGDFNVHHKDWLIYSDGTDRPDEFCYNFSISSDLTQMVNFPTWILHCDSHNLPLLDLFISSDSSICSTTAFPPLGNSDHDIVSVSIDFPSNTKGDALFYCMDFHYSCDDWGGL